MTQNRMRLGLPLALGVLAVALGSRWAEAWRNLPDLDHAWLVPALAGYLAWERWLDRPSASPNPRPQALVLAAALLAAAYLAGRVLLSPFPAWPAALWLYSLGGWGLALVLILAIEGPARARHFTFPVLFTGTALPWLTLIDVHIILPLRTGLASVAAELIHALGYPASADGAVITVGRGLVGVDEACGGVRSLQSGIMVALFLGDLLRLKTARRFALVGIAIGLALLSNLGRTCFLAWQAAAHGADATARWHDRAGWAQLIIALGGLSLVAWRWSRFSPAPIPRPVTAKIERLASGWRPELALLSLVILTELAVMSWFRPWSFQSGRTAQWDVLLPAHDPSYESTPFDENVRALLRCDDYQAGRWQTPDGARRAGYVLKWRRGEIARDIITLHNPEVCLPGSGNHLLAHGKPEPVSLPTGSTLPFELSEFEGQTGRFYVFYVAWDQTNGRPLSPANDVGWSGWWAHRIGEVSSRRDRFEACVIAIAIYDESGQDAARKAFTQESSALLAPPRID